MITVLDFAFIPTHDIWLCLLLIFIKQRTQTWQLFLRKETRVGMHANLQLGCDREHKMSQEGREDQPLTGLESEDCFWLHSGRRADRESDLEAGRPWGQQPLGDMRWGKSIPRNNVWGLGAEAQWACVKNCQQFHSAILGGKSYREQCTTIDPKQGDCGPQATEFLHKDQGKLEAFVLQFASVTQCDFRMLLHASLRPCPQHLLLLHHNIQKNLRTMVLSALESNTNMKLVLHSHSGVIFALLANFFFFFVTIMKCLSLCTLWRFRNRFT